MDADRSDASQLGHLPIVNLVDADDLREEGLLRGQRRRGALGRSWIFFSAGGRISFQRRRLL